MSESNHIPKEIEECFEYYHSLGHGRSALAVSKKFSIPFEDVNEWKSLHAWDEKVKERESDVFIATERLYADKSRNIRNRLIGQVGKLLDDVEGCSLGLPFRIRDVDDLRKLAQAYKLLVEANTLALTKGAVLAEEDSPMSWAALIQKFNNQESTEHTEEDFKDV